MSSRRRDESRSRSPERLPKGVQEITEKDFFLKNDEFRLWLKEEKDKASTTSHARFAYPQRFHITFSISPS
ncbi:hypothetical protein FRC15_008050 [Serendipita sp. 397]|nr:hypothetical protein FRC15_008050 [Serendipita sp. 397]